MRTVVKHTYVQMACTVKCITTITCILAYFGTFFTFYSAQASVLKNLNAIGQAESCEVRSDGQTVCDQRPIIGSLIYSDPNPNQFDVLTLASNGAIDPTWQCEGCSLHLELLGIDSLDYHYPNLGPGDVIQNLTLTEGLVFSDVNLTAYTHQNPNMFTDHNVWTISKTDASHLLSFKWVNPHGEAFNGDIVFFVPEPGSFVLFGFGLISLLACRRLNNVSGGAKIGVGA